METLLALWNYPSQFKYFYGDTFASNYSFPATIGVVYLTLVGGGTWLMKLRKERYEAKTISLIHNFNMFAISVITFLGIFYGAIKTVVDRPSEAYDILFCDAERKSTPEKGGTMWFWIYLFYLSKFYELFDTGLIVVRKTPLKFLHVYHHWATALLCILSLNTAIPYQWAATGFNAFVHIPMYLYYFLAILKINVWWKKYITVIQIIQFCGDVTAGGISYYLNLQRRSQGSSLCASWDFEWANPVAIGIILSYLLLFIQFYYHTYTAEGKGRRPTSDKATSESLKKTE